MSTSLTDLLARRVRGARSSVIREILALTETADVLSLAGGMPSPESFPVDDLAAAAHRAITIDAATALQYARTEGIPDLRALVAEMATSAAGRAFEASDVLVTTGSQQALDLLGRAFLEPGDVVAVESPGYLGAIQAFGAHDPEWLAVPVDADGLDTGALEERLVGGLRPKLVYTATDFQNPTGAVLSVERRRHLAELADRWGFFVVEDDPYGRIRFGEPAHPPVAAFTDRCVSLGTTSKTIAPGLRVGWLVGPPDVVGALALLKQSVDLNTSALSQHLTVALLRSPGWIARRAEELCTFYRPRAEVLARSLVGSLAGAVPEAEVRPARGGLFLWVGLPGVDTAALLPKAIEAGVAFVPGAAFGTDGAPSHHLRASFATLSEPDLAEAATRLAGALHR